MGKTSEELADLLKGTKETIDNAYDATKRKHGVENADTAMELFLKRDVLAYFTGDESTRDNMQELLDRPYEIYQVLFDYAMSSFILNDMNSVPYAELIDYSRDSNDRSSTHSDEFINYSLDSNMDFDYSGRKSVQIVALAAAFNPYWTVNLVAYNKKLRESLIDSFIQERYVEDRRDELDNAANIPKLVRFTDTDERIFMNKDRLNLAIEKMNEADDLGEYIPPTRRSGTTKS